MVDLIEELAKLDKETRKLIEQGKLIEAGWVSLRLQMVPSDALPGQLDDMRTAFFSGAQFLHALIINQKMDKLKSLGDELHRWAGIFKKARKGEPPPPHQPLGERKPPKPPRLEALDCVIATTGHTVTVTFTANSDEVANILARRILEGVEQHGKLFDFTADLQPEMKH